MEIIIRHTLNLGLTDLEEMIELYLNDKNIQTNIMRSDLIEQLAEHLYDCIESRFD